MTMNATTTKWTLEQRANAQNKHFRQDRLCLSKYKPVIQATRERGAIELPEVWVGHSCIGNITFKTLEGARAFAESMGYEGIYL